MRRALLTNEFAPAHGGVERLLHYRASEYRPEELTVFAPDDGDTSAFDRAQAFAVQRAGGWLTRWPLLGPLWRSFAPMLRCRREHRRRPFDVLECGQAFPASLFARALHRKDGTPYLVWVHGNDVLGPGRYRLLRTALRRSLADAHRVVANSAYTARIVAEMGVDAAKVSVIDPPVDTRKFRPEKPSEALRRRYGLGRQKVVLTVCRLVARKGVDVCLNALAMLRAQGLDFRYLVVGDGPEAAALKTLAMRLDLDSNVIFAGTVPDGELPAHYNLAALFVMPSRFVPEDGSVEGLGLVYLEAMASGLPVVAGRSGGVTGIVRHGENGLLVEPGSAGELARAIRSLLEDEDLARELGCRGMARVDQPRNWRILDV